MKLSEIFRAAQRKVEPKSTSYTCNIVDAVNRLKNGASRFANPMASDEYARLLGEEELDVSDVLYDDPTGACVCRPNDEAFTHRIIMLELAALRAEEEGN